mgnify:CR=1 FL=1
MIRDITIGQYYPAKSVIHKLDPRTKLFGTTGFYHFCIFVSLNCRLCGSDGVPCRNDPDFHGSGEVYL